MTGYGNIDRINADEVIFKIYVFGQTGLMVLNLIYIYYHSYYVISILYSHVSIITNKYSSVDFN